MEDAARSLVAFLADVHDAPEVVWAAALAYLELAVATAKEQRWGRFRYSADVELRRLREGVADGMKLARLAAEMQAAARLYDAEKDDLAGALHDEAVSAAAAARREQTLPAQLARLEKQRRRRAGATSNVHLSQEWQLAAIEAHRAGRAMPRSEDYDGGRST